MVAVGPEQFIIGNDGSAISQHGHYFELLFIKRAGSIVYYDGKVRRGLAEEYPYSTGDAKLIGPFIILLVNKIGNSPCLTVAENVKIFRTLTTWRRVPFPPME